MRYFISMSDEPNIIANNTKMYFLIYRQIDNESWAGCGNILVLSFKNFNDVAKKKNMLLKEGEHYGQESRKQ